MNRVLTPKTNQKYRLICYLSLPFLNLSLIETRCCNSSTFLFNAVIASSFSVATFSLKEEKCIWYKTEGGAQLFSRTLRLAQREKDKTDFCPRGHMLLSLLFMNLSTRVSFRIRAKYPSPYKPKLAVVDSFECQAIMVADSRDSDTIESCN